MTKTTKTTMKIDTELFWELKKYEVENRIDSHDEAIRNLLQMTKMDKPNLSNESKTPITNMTKESEIIKTPNPTQTTKEPLKLWQYTENVPNKPEKGKHYIRMENDMCIYCGQSKQRIEVVKETCRKN